MKDIFDELLLCKNEGIPCILVTVVEKSGECPSTVGKKMIVRENGSSFGTVGGGALEHFAIEKCKILISEQSNLLEKYMLNEGEILKGTTTLPMACGGMVTLYYDYIGIKAYVYIFGAGHVGQALANVLKTLNYHLTVIDNRKEIFDKFINADRKVHSSFTDYIKKEGIKEGSYVVVCTPSHKNDFNVIKQIIEMNLKPKYMGMLCSRAKLQTFLDTISKDLKDLPNFYSPIGLDVGGESPEEIAISITSEILAVYHNKSGHKHMKNGE